MRCSPSLSSPLSFSHSLSLSLSVARRREYLITFYKHNWRALQSMLHLFSCAAAVTAAATHVRHINNAVIISALRTHTNTTAQTISLLVFHTEKNKGQYDWAHTHSHTHTHTHTLIHSAQYMLFGKLTAYSCALPAAQVAAADADRQQRCRQR